MRKVVKTIINYHCEYCGKRYNEDEEFYCKDHEKNCMKNPDLKACRTCDNRDLNTMTCLKGKDMDLFAIDCSEWGKS